MLPGSLRRRITQLYALHRSDRATQIRSSTVSTLDSSRDLIYSSQPQLEYYGTEGESEGNAPCLPIPADGPESPGLPFGQSPSKGNLVSAPARYESDSGLKWNRVVPGINLLRNAGYEAQQAHTDTRLVRSLYINGLLYLLDALPGNLSSEEIRSVQSRLPESVKSTILAFPTTPARGLDPAGKPNAQCARPGCSDHPSYLHRLLSACIVCCFLVIQLLIPSARRLLRNLYRYERSHRITERLIGATLDAADSLGKGGASFGSALVKLHNGRVGTAISGLAAWWIEGVAGGIFEGVREGMAILGVVRSTNNSGSNRPNDAGCHETTFKST